MFNIRATSFQHFPAATTLHPLGCDTDQGKAQGAERSEGCNADPDLGTGCPLISEGICTTVRTSNGAVVIDHD